MLIWLGEWLSQFFSPLNVFHYQTFRAIMAALTALVVAISFGPWVIRWLQHKQMGQPIRSDGPQTHLSKAGTPTMGGVLILIAILVACLLWGDWSNARLWLVMAVTTGFGLIGWIDDYKKLIKCDPRGLPGRWKYCFQSLLAVIAIAVLWLITPDAETTLLIPYLKATLLPLGALYFVLAYFVIVGTSNAVNLTDGLDGLAILPVALVAGALGIFAYVTGHTEFSQYLSLPYVKGAGELSIFCAAMVGAGLGFLWFNAYPAQIFMGDVGALGLGAGLGIIAVVIHQEMVLFIMGGVFVVETLSVMLQVASFKLTGRRLFKMAPIHHHFELQGWPEPRVIVRFWIMTVLCVLVGLAALKIR